LWIRVLTYEKNTPNKELYLCTNGGLGLYYRVGVTGRWMVAAAAKTGNGGCRAAANAADWRGEAIIAIEAEMRKGKGPIENESGFQRERTRNLYLGGHIHVIYSYFKITQSHKHML